MALDEVDDFLCAKTRNDCFDICAYLIRIEPSHLQLQINATDVQVSQVGRPGSDDDIWLFDQPFQKSSGFR